MTVSTHFDVAVVGAGPGGASAGLAAAQAGMRVAIFEKAALPRYKTCGGGLLQRSLRLLPRDVRGYVERECFTAEMHHHFSAHGKKPLSYSAHRDAPIVSMVMRDRFDHWLAVCAQAAGASLLTEVALQDVTPTADRVELKTSDGTFTADFLVAADGVSSLVARKCGLPESPWVIPALECEVKVDQARFEAFSHAARFDFGLTPHGYAWVFPKREHLSIGVLTTRRGSCNLNDEYRKYAETIGLTNPISEERHGYMIPIAPRPKLFSVPRVFFVGDAAGLADPVTAEGISAAIASGQLAGKAIVANRDSAPGAMTAYRLALETAYFGELKVARVLARAVYDWPRIRGWVLGRHGQRLSEYVTDVVMGTASYQRAFRRPRNYWRLLRTP